ncbi:MAG: formate/nitrite transporter family protein [Treponema sp.]|jgi:formate/nitrite transporter|nr:formate/nitrite transporter family protein [Treponema sp.]
MNLFSPAEITMNYADSGKAKTAYPVVKTLVLAILAGFLIGFGAAVTNTASHAVVNVSAVRIINGLLFPFGLAMVLLTGAELFTGNCLIVISVLNKALSPAKMLRNWFLVYTGNFIGAVLLAAGCAFFGQLDYSSGGLALYTIKTAAVKCSLPFFNALVSGIFCNILVCLGVLCGLSAKDTAGRIFGAFIPVSFFVICGFEHCIANMYYIPAGFFALRIPRYVQIAQEVGLDISSLNLINFFSLNLLPVTLGNIIGGTMIGTVMWACNLKPKGEYECE